ncbi:signal transduction histidine kinase [Streptomyces sp. SAI-208]|uniref:sensor histidine kinase n=1 Tax=Streptomyces sp. SAI-208 TaxID=2940550 RepID=UPI002476970C|nr:ATP-binding protein [Streptomyces sp. SAI-208]MDH6606020.1 signal transduction histidine kinase [Streptomyces sp. SAI-208]
MSHLRAPAARADRREGGRHGRPVARPAPSLPETHIRPQLLRLAVLPPVAVALSGCAAVLFTVRSTEARPGLILWGVLAGAVSVALAAILIAAVAADRAARTVGDRVGALRRSSARREADLRALVEGLRRGEIPPGRTPRSGPPDDADEFELLAADLARAHDGAVTAVVQAAQLSSQAGSEQKLEVFVNLARRLQSLVHREISILDELENEIEDPDLLKGLFHVDHLATRIRRHAENLAVLGGAVSRRQWSNPVSMTEVLRSAIAEVEQYSRVKLVPPIDGTLRGHAVADVIHLLAELVENATVFSAPHTQVLLRANLVTSGLAVEVEDRGLGMPVAEQHRMNALLSDPDQVNVASLLADGRIGLFVVSQLAKRHGIHVRLQSNIYGGVQAVLVVPQALLGSAPGAVRAQPPEAAGTGGGAGAAVAPQGPGRPRSGHEARHRGVPADPRRESRGTEAGPNGSTAPTATTGTAVPVGQGARHGRDGRGPRLLNGSGRAPAGGAGGSVGDGPAPDGAGAVSRSAGSGPGGRESVPGGEGHFLNGGSGAPGSGGSVPNAGGRPSGGGGAGASGGASPEGGRVPGDGALSSGGGALSVGDGGALAPGGGGVPGAQVAGGGIQAGGGGVSPNGGPAGVSPVVPGGDALASDGGPGGSSLNEGPTVPGGNGAVGDRQPGGGSGASGARSGRPAPLPVRGARGTRPTPAEAVPGIRPDDRRLVAEHVTAPPTPRTGTVRGTMGKPQLPRRRAQEHIAPQLRGGPAPRQDTEYVAGHDPGLMAAFQRGIGLAEAQQHLEQEDGEPATSPPLPLPSPRTEADHMGSTPTGSTPTGSTPTGPTHMDAAHMDSAYTGAPGTGTATGTGSSASVPLESRTAPSPHPSASFDFDLDLDQGANPMDAAPTTDAAATDVTPMERPHISQAHGLDHDRTTPRHDGSAPAG